MRLNKNELQVGKVELLYANPQYARARYPDGLQDTVSLRDLAPGGDYSLHTSLSEGCPQNTSTGYEETETWSPFEDFEDPLSSDPSNGDGRVPEKGAHPPTNNSEDEQSTRRRL